MTPVAAPASAVGAPNPAATRALTVKAVDDEGGFAALADAWNEAAEQSSQRGVFLRHEWARAAWQWRREDRALALLVALEAARPVAILPLMRSRASPRALELLSVPDTQFADLVAPARRAAEAADAFAAALVARHDWDCLHLDYLRASSEAASLLVPALAKRGLPARVEARGSNAFVPLDGSFEDYLGARSRRLRKALNLAANRLRKQGAVRVVKIDALAQADVHARALEDAIAISASSWKRRTGHALDQPGPQAFIRELTALARARGWLALWLLMLDERPLAMEYQLVDKGVIHALRADFLAECEAISPGTHLFRTLLEAGFGAGLSRYYLGPGANPYKARWAEHGEPMVVARVWNRTLRGRLKWLVEAVAKPPLRRMRDRFASRSAKPRTDADGEPA